MDKGGDYRVSVPQRLMELFKDDVPFLIKYHPAGLWPIGPRLINSDQFQEMVKGKEFAQNFEVVIMPKAGR